VDQERERGVKKHTVALDSNLLLLLLVGTVHRELVVKHKRLRAFSLADLDLLTSVLEGKTLVTTPNVLTEVSNLVVFGITEPQRSMLLAGLAEVSRRVDEVYCQSATAASIAEFARLGLTDSAWLSVCGSHVSLLTDDLQLYLDAQHRGIDAYNFNHIREARGLM
jgi:hypothetical protein